MERVIGMTEAKSRLAEIVGQVRYGKETFVLQRRGRPMAVLISVDEFERLRSAAVWSDTDLDSPLPPALQRRQQALVAQSRLLRERLGPPEMRLAELFSDLPPDDDHFWIEVQEAI